MSTEAESSLPQSGNTNNNPSNGGFGFGSSGGSFGGGQSGGGYGGPFGGPFGNMGGQNLPNATAVLVLGILSIIFSCCCYGIVGLLPAIIALVLYKSDNRLYQQNLGLYTLSSYKNLNAGRICALIGLIIGILAVLYIIIVIIYYGSTELNKHNPFDQFYKKIQKA